MTAQLLPEYVRKQSEAKGERDERLALDLLQLAVKAAEGRSSSYDDILVGAEKFWQWTTSDAWPWPERPLK